jgi:hypothetical protein
MTCCIYPDLTVIPILNHAFHVSQVRDMTCHVSHVTCHAQTCHMTCCIYPDLTVIPILNHAFHVSQVRDVRVYYGDYCETPMSRIPQIPKCTLLAALDSPKPKYPVLGSQTLLMILGWEGENPLNKELDPPLLEHAKPGSQITETGLVIPKSPKMVPPKPPLFAYPL